MGLGTNSTFSSQGPLALCCPAQCVWPSRCHFLSPLKIHHLPLHLTRSPPTAIWNLSLPSLSPALFFPYYNTQINSLWCLPRKPPPLCYPPSPPLLTLSVPDIVNHHILLTTLAELRIGNSAHLVHIIPDKSHQQVLVQALPSGNWGPLRLNIWTASIFTVH